MGFIKILGLIYYFKFTPVSVSLLFLLPLFWNYFLTIENNLTVSLSPKLTNIHSCLGSWLCNDNGVVDLFVAFFFYSLYIKILTILFTRYSINILSCIHRSCKGTWWRSGVSITGLLLTQSPKIPPTWPATCFEP